MAFKNQGTTIISDAGEFTVDKFTVSANARQTVGVTATTSPTSALSPSVFQGSVSGYTSGGEPLQKTIDKFPFSSDTNATDVGDLIVNIMEASSQSSTTNGYLSGGLLPPYTAIIQKFPFATDTNSSAVGNLSQGRRRPSGQSSETYGYSSGGLDSTFSDVINKFSFSSDGNGVDVGNLTQARSAPTGQSSTTHGYSSAGSNPSPALNTIDKFSFSTDTNASDVGDLSQARSRAAGQSSTTHGYTSGGIISNPPLVMSNTIDKFPFSSDTNATDVGDITQASGRYGAAGQSSTSSGYTSGGFGGSPAANSNVIDKFPFSSDTNATDVGDLTVARYEPAGNQARTLS